MVKGKEEQSALKIIFPLHGVDLRNIYIFATPRSLLVKIRSKISNRHRTSHLIVCEEIRKEIDREFRFPMEIEKDAVSVQLVGKSLEVTIHSARSNDQTPFPKLIPVRYQTAYF